MYRDHTDHHHHHRPHHDEPGVPGAPTDPESGERRGRRRGGPGRHRGPGAEFGPFGPAFGRGPGGFGPEGFGPGGPRGRRRPKGAVREAVLSLLADGPANGYGLMRQITERTDGSWRPSPGSVYPTLSQLVDEGLISPTSDEQGADFTLTDTGRQYVADHTEALAAVWADPMKGAPSHAALRESGQALFSALAQFRYATDAQREQAAKVLDEARRSLHRLLAE